MDNIIYDALTIARYTINRCNAEGTPISNLKLQKLLYYIQAVFLCLNDRVCFSDVIEAWPFGPVIPVVYHEFKKYGSNTIPEVIDYVDDNPNSNTFFEFVKFDDSIIDDDDKQLINETLELYGKYSATQLVEMTHKEDPWINNYKRDLKHTVIPVESMRDFFKDYYVRN